MPEAGSTRDSVPGTRCRHGDAEPDTPDPVPSCVMGEAELGTRYPEPFQFGS